MLDGHSHCLADANDSLAGVYGQLRRLLLARSAAGPRARLHAHNYVQQKLTRIGFIL